MAELLAGNVAELLQTLDTNPGAALGIPFPGLNAVVWVRPSVEDRYDITTICGGDEEHEPHVTEEALLLSADEVAAGLFNMALRQGAVLDVLSSRN